jgi:hypothetical protein
MVCRASSCSQVRSAVRLASLYPVNVARGVHDFISSCPASADNRIVYLLNLYGKKLSDQARMGVPVWGATGFLVAPQSTRLLCRQESIQVPDKHSTPALANQFVCTGPRILCKLERYDFRFNCRSPLPRVRPQFQADCGLESD